MKTAVVTTTINVPRVLALYAKYNPNAMIFVVGDRKTPDIDVVDFLVEFCPNHAYYGIDTQYKLGHTCARVIPENSIQRRNIGFLEALRWGAEIIVSVDDDNIPLQLDYFNAFEQQLAAPFQGLQASSLSSWFDIGALLQPKAPHRGFPYGKKSDPVFEPVTDAKVGVAAGICMGNPDISAVERIANGPTVHGVSEILRSGVVVDPRRTWTVFNSQNTAILRELVPAWFMLPHCGRYDDIFASLIVQRIMRETGHYVHFGKPFVWQSRNQHDLTSDLALEIAGMQKIEALAQALDDISLAHSEGVLAKTRHIFSILYATDMLPSAACEAALAWTDDCERVMR